MMVTIHDNEARAWGGPLDGQMLPTGAPVVFDTIHPNVSYQPMLPVDELWDDGHTTSAAPMPELYVLRKYGWYLDPPVDVVTVDEPRFAGWAYIRDSELLEMSQYIVCGGHCVIQFFRVWWRWTWWR